MSKDILDKIKEIDEEIERAKSDLAKAEGRSSQIQEQLAKEFKVNSLEEAKGLLDELNQKVSQQEELVRNSLEKIQKEFTW